MRIHVGVTSSEKGADMSGVAVQGFGSSYRVVAMIGRELTVTEAVRPDLERWLLAACWCVRRLSCYTMYVPSVKAAIPQAAMVAVLKLQDLHCKLQALYVEL